MTFNGGSFEAQLIGRLQSELMAHAVNVMEQPQGKEGYDYGRAVGIYNGIQWAIAVVTNMLGESDEREKQLDMNYAGTRQ